MESGTEVQHQSDPEDQVEPASVKQDAKEPMDSSESLSGGRGQCKQ